VDNYTFWIWLLLIAALGLFLFLINWKALGKALITKLYRHFVYILLTDLYDESLLEFYSAVKRTGFQTIAELNLRAERGKVIDRPLGTGRKFPNFSGLMFDVAQLHTLPVEDSTPVDTKVVLGPRAKRPVLLDTPIIVAGMAYGLGLSAKAKIALARGAAMAGTANNSGEGPFLQAERDNAKHWILQYNRGFWNKDPEILLQADAIEIQFGQGSMAGISHQMPAKEIDETLRQAFPISPGRSAVIRARQQEMDEPDDIVELVKHIRSKVDGVPVGIKIASSKRLELDLDLALKAEVDFITLCGVQAGTRGSPASLQDDHGLPTIFALVRAVRFLKRRRAKDSLTLIMDGGFTETGDVLKALALGADAVSMGTAALFAISHTQVLKAMPWEPPTQIVWYNGKFADQFDENLGAQNLANFLKACTSEIGTGLRVMGKTSIRELSRKDLFAMDQTSAEIAGVPLGYQPCKQGIVRHRNRSRRKRPPCQPRTKSKLDQDQTRPDQPCSSEHPSAEQDRKNNGGEEYRRVLNAGNTYRFHFKQHTPRYKYRSRL